MEAPFQPVTDPSDPAVIEMANLTLRCYFLTPAREPNLTKPDEFHEGIRALNVIKAPGPNGLPKRALNHAPQRALSLLIQIFNAILLTHHFPTM
jgi:hypothetical protein